MSTALESLARLRERVETERCTAVPAPRLAARIDRLGIDGFAAFSEQGIPTRRLEDWKGTNLGRVEAMEFSHVGGGAAQSAAVDSATLSTGLSTDLEADASVDLLFMDGRLVGPSPARSELPDGVCVLSLAQAATEIPEVVEKHLGMLPDLKKQSLVALNTALFEDLAVVHLTARAHAHRPIRIRAVATAAGANDADAVSACFPRLLVVAERESQATILFESACQGMAPGLTIFVAEFHLADGARIESVQLQTEGSERVHVTSSHARLEGAARFDSHVFSLGTGLVRSELAVTLDAPGAETRMRGFFLGREHGHVDHFTTVDHATAHTTSDQEYRGVLGDDSQGVFRGRVIIRPGAQKADARQSNPNLLLSNRASIDTKPQLEIYTDDVRASHGATIGQLDQDALFFLRARGIDEAVARLVLTRGFAHCIVDGLADPELREQIGGHVESALTALQRSKTRGTARGDGDDE